MWYELQPGRFINLVNLIYVAFDDEHFEVVLYFVGDNRFPFALTKEQYNRFKSKMNGTLRS